MDLGAQLQNSGSNDHVLKSEYLSWRNSPRNFTNLKHRKKLIHGPAEVLPNGLHPRRVHLTEGVDDDGQLLEGGELGFDLLQALNGVDEVRVPKWKPWPSKIHSNPKAVRNSICRG